MGCDLPSSSNVEEGVAILINFKGRGIIFSSNVEEGVKSFSMAILTMLASLTIVTVLTNCDIFNHCNNCDQFVTIVNILTN